ncbi:hypothetical protein BJ170DRAFT_349811 [Xylariales sp. AK1849]|nr:hypothetical protein BJ170DRAFT_349811 [Xylariales sp. AK1849]
MAGRIEIYLDIASMYSYVAFKQLLETGSSLGAYGVEVDIKPVLLGGINAGSGSCCPVMFRLHANAPSICTHAPGKYCHYVLPGFSYRSTERYFCFSPTSLIITGSSNKQIKATNPHGLSPPRQSTALLTPNGSKKQLDC